MNKPVQAFEGNFLGPSLMLLRLPTLTPNPPPRRGTMHSKSRLPMPSRRKFRKQRGHIWQCFSQDSAKEVATFRKERSKLSVHVTDTICSNENIVRTSNLTNFAQVCEKRVGFLTVLLAGMAAAEDPRSQPRLLSHEVPAPRRCSPTTGW